MLPASISFLFMQSQQARRNSALDLYQVLRTSDARVNTAGVGPFDSAQANFEHPSVQQAVQRDVLYDIHKGASAKEVAKYVFPEPGRRPSSDHFSTKRVIDIAPIGDESVPRELVEVMELVVPSDTQDPPLRFSNTSQ